MLKLAGKEDFNLIYDMSQKFVGASGYESLVDKERSKEIINVFLNSDKAERIIILNDDKGLIAGIATPMLFSPKLIATEVMWWVEPEHRKNNVGRELLEAFEFWAKNVSKCNFVAMTCLDEKIAEFYKANDYKPYEYTYLKEI